MATPTSHPRPSPQKSHLTPTASGLSPPPPSSTHSQASKKPLHYRNGSLQHNQPSPSATPGGAGGIAMSRSGTANGTGSTPMMRSGTNTSSVGKTPAPMRAGRGMSASTTSAAGSPSLTAAANMIMQGGTGLTPQGGLGLGLTPLGMGMGTGTSGVQGLAGMSPAEQEEERRRRLEVIKEIIGTKAAGLVCQEGVERVARKVGLECLWEEAKVVGEKTVLSIAGSGLLVEVDFQEDDISEVGLILPASKEGQDGVARWVKKGGEVLKRDLKGDEADGYVELERFAENLAKLAKMDQLGGEQISCFDAVDGIFKSLQRVYKWEIGRAKKEQHAGVEDEVMCKHSGRPQMHAERRVGLAVQYWKDRRLLSKSPDMSEAMDLDNEATGDSMEEDLAKQWSILVECEACSANAYHPIRLSDQWVSKEVERPAGQQLDSDHISIDQIDWLDVKDLGLGEGKIPDVRFVARFEPPVILPLQLAMQVQQSVDSPVDQATVLPMTYEALLFADIDAQSTLLTTPRTVEQRILSKGSKKRQKYAFTLFIQSQEFAQSMVEIPFKHPMQLISLLPSLRQWAVVGTLLRRNFTPSPLEEPPQEIESNKKISFTNGNNSAKPSFQTLEEEFADFLSSPPTTTTTTGGKTSASSNDKARAVEVSLTTSQQTLPRFAVHFQNPKYGGKLASVAFSVGLNGGFEGVEVDDGRPPSLPAAAAAAGGAEGMDVVDGELATVRLRSKVKKVLEIGESIGGVVEWLSR